MQNSLIHQCHIDPFAPEQTWKLIQSTGNNNILEVKESSINKLLISASLLINYDVFVN